MFQGGIKKDYPAAVPELTSEQDAALRETFSLLDADQSQLLEAREVEMLVRAVDSEADVAAVMAMCDADDNGALDARIVGDRLARHRERIPHDLDPVLLVKVAAVGDLKTKCR